MKGNYTEGLSAESNARLPWAGDPSRDALAEMAETRRQVLSLGVRFWPRTGAAQTGRRLPEGRYSFPAAADLPNSAVISSKRFFSDSPAFANTCEQAARNFSSADAVIPETTSRDW